MGAINDVRLSLVVPADVGATPPASGGGSGVAEILVRRDGAEAARLDVRALAPGDTVEWTDPNRPVGTYTYDAAAVDGAGNEGPRSSAVVAVVTESEVVVLLARLAVRSRGTLRSRVRPAVALNPTARSAVRLGPAARSRTRLALSVRP